jgi:hypothetical protein
MTSATPVAPRLVGLVVWTLAAVMAAGASTPRLRAPGRERVGRTGIARAGTIRTDDSRGWVAPHADRDPDCTVADAPVGTIIVGTAPDGAWPAAWAPDPTRSLVGPTVSTATASLVSGPRLTRWLGRAGGGRAPPLA